MTRLVALLLPLILSGCLQLGVGAGGPPPPQPARDTLDALARAAYAAYAGALSTTDPSQLAPVFSGAVLERMRARAADLRLLHESEQLQAVAESLVHWSAGPGSGEAVLAVQGRERLIIAGRPTAWDAYAGQWLFTVTWRSGWSVSAAVDLPPPDWWPA